MANATDNNTPNVQNSGHKNRPENRPSYEALEEENAELHALAETASNDAERAIQRAEKAELDLRCLSATTVDAKAYEQAFANGVTAAIQLFDDEMRETGDARNARQAMKTLLRFGPQAA